MKREQKKREEIFCWPSKWWHKRHITARPMFSCHPSGFKLLSSAWYSFYLDFHGWDVNKDTNMQTAARGDASARSDACTHNDVSEHTHTHTHGFMRWAYSDSLLPIPTHPPAPHRHVNGAKHSYEHVCRSTYGTSATIQAANSEDNQSVTQQIMTAPRFLSFAL